MGVKFQRRHSGKINTSLLYNNELKVRYEDTILPDTEEASALEGLFYATRRAEFKLDKDLYAFSLPEARDLFAKIIVRLPCTNLDRCRRYVRWCREQGIEETAQGFFWLTLADTEAARGHMVSSPSMLKFELDSFSNEASYGRNYYGTKFASYWWLAYAGVPENRIDSVRKDEIIPEKLCIQHGTHKYQLYPEAVPYLAKAFEGMPESCSFGEAFVSEYGTRSHAWINDTFWKVSGFRAGRDVSDLVMSYPTIMKSGMFYELYSDEKVGYKIDFFTAAVDAAMKIAGSYDTISRDSIREEYNCWKLAFSYA